MRYQDTVKKIREKQNIDFKELRTLLDEKASKEDVQYLYAQAREVADEVYGKRVFKRGLIEFTNYCKNDCYYCGIRRSNACAERYRLDKDTILACCEKGYTLGYRTFVLQGGEDGYFTDERVCEIVSEIRQNYPDCAITLSIGEKSKESYQKYFDAGADRYLLRHETANAEHYAKLHPAELSLRNRKQCLYDLKDIGYQVGCGFMVGAPYQTIETLYEDLQFIKELEPQMVGIGPFIPQKETPFASEKAGTLERTLRLLAIIRLIHSNVLLPATTALGTIHENGRELGILAGANVVMPNLSPKDVREKYKLYDNKACVGDEAVEGDANLTFRIKQIGYDLVCDRGDFVVK
ncbi:MAG: [Agathobacter sp.]|nr:[FeFe] hydrogenase H-cluster radical SAM maturase HydE [Agathobacter sp.]